MTLTLRKFRGTDLNILDEGDGPAIVLLHGWSYDLHLWDALSAALVAAGWRVVRMDLRGHGGSPVQGPYPFVALSGDLEAVIGELELDRPVILGLSLGGFLAMRYAIDHPDGVRGVVLADTWTTPISLDTAHAQSLPTTADGPDALWTWWLERNGGGQALQDPAKKAAGERLSRQNADGLRHAIAACASRQPVELDELGTIQAPVLVLAGENDRLFSPAMHQEISDAIANSRLHIIAGAGHISVADAPAEFTGAVTQFLTEILTNDPNKVDAT